MDNVDNMDQRALGIIQEGHWKKGVPAHWAVTLELGEGLPRSMETLSVIDVRDDCAVYIRGLYSARQSAACKASLGA